MTTMQLNVNGVMVGLEYKQICIDSVVLDLENPRIKFLLQQLHPEERTDDAAAFLLHTQEDVITTKKSILATSGLQEPIFLRSNMVVAEGNRRVTAVRELKREQPNRPEFQYIPAWVFPEDTPEDLIQQAIYNMHLNPKRTWSPFERALTLRELNNDGSTIATLAARFEMKEEEVRQFITAAELMESEYVPLLDDPSDPETRKKFSYFLEYVRGPRNYNDTYHNLDSRFANWVLTEKIPKAEKVRKLGKILSNANAVLALEDEGFEAAIEVLVEEDPNEDPLFKAFDKASRFLQRLNPQELLELRSNHEKQARIIELARSVNQVIEIVGIDEV